MKIALMNEWSQAPKNAIIYKELNDVSTQGGHVVFNVGMANEKDHWITYVHLGIIASLLLNSRAVDFVITGCGTGQGALMSLNAFSGVTCGYCIEPTDAFLFTQINNGNALSLPFGKGFGWGAELNLRYIFEKTFSEARGQGYPNDKKELQNNNAAKLNEMKDCVAKPYLTALQSLDPVLLKEAIINEKFQSCFFDNSQDRALTDFVKGALA